MLLLFTGQGPLGRLSFTEPSVSEARRAFNKTRRGFAFPLDQETIEDIGHVDDRGFTVQVIDDQTVGIGARADEVLLRVAGDEAHDP
jgi:hypothetical protein